MQYEALKRAYADLTAPGAPFEIVTVPVRGQAIRAYKNAPPNLRAFWLASAAFGANEYIVYGDERLTYDHAHAQVASFAAWLVKQGVRGGDRVGIAMRNYPEWLIAYWACVSIGVAAVGFNAWWVGEELAYAVKDSAPKVIVCDEERLERILARPDIVDAAQSLALRSATDRTSVV